MLSYTSIYNFLQFNVDKLLCQSLAWLIVFHYIISLIHKTVDYVINYILNVNNMFKFFLLGNLEFVFQQNVVST